MKVLLGRIAEANTRVTQLKHEIAESRKQIQARETVELERIKK
ncbi:hypothetical protein JCM19241_3874 [Vibrio ishigakensis]|uniref:Uncharacterized protein n=1 Tax=Vibrio ishigakensis TaxID=1481914 RepID=A0A0B8QGX5_9VIBR|nr:hypothetical protein JCM19241_3874 [Vibrio ishigakensis]